MRGRTALALTLATLAAAVAARAQAPALVERGRAAFMSQGCYGCHTLGVVGTPIGPDLSRIGRTYGADDLARWLRDPAAVRPHAHMPKLALSAADVTALAAFLSSLR